MTGGLIVTDSLQPYKRDGVAALTSCATAQKNAVVFFTTWTLDGARGNSAVLPLSRRCRRRIAVRESPRTSEVTQGRAYEPTQVESDAG